MIAGIFLMLLFPLGLIFLYHILWRMRIVPLSRQCDAFKAKIGAFMCFECQLMLRLYGRRYWSLFLLTAGVMGICLGFGKIPRWDDVLFLLLILPLMMFDWRYCLLPDLLVYPLLWGGLLLSLLNVSVLSIEQRLWGVIIAYGFMLTLYLGSYAYYGREAVGRGDLKFAAAIGAWIGFEWIVIHLFLSAVIALLWICLETLLKLKIPRKTIPFGPFLGISGIILYFITRFIMIV